MKFTILMMIVAFITFSVVDVTQAYNAVDREMIKMHLSSASISLLFACSCFSQLSIMHLRERLDGLEKKC